MAVVTVLGNPRGGTTAVAGVLTILGVQMGDEKDSMAHEDLELRQRPVHWLVPEIERRADDPTWGWKDPVLIDHWADVSRARVDWRVLAVFRDPYAVAMTEVAATGIAYATAIQRALTRTSCMVAAMRRDAAGVILPVSFEHLLRYPIREARRIAEHVGMTLDEEKQARIVTFVDPQARYRCVECLAFPCECGG